MTDKKVLKEEDSHKVSSGNFEEYDFETTGYCKDCKKNVALYGMCDEPIWCSKCGGFNLKKEH